MISRAATKPPQAASQALSYRSTWLPAAKTSNQHLHVEQASSKNDQQKTTKHQSKDWRRRKRRSKLLRLPAEIWQRIFEFVFEGRSMIDITTTRPGEESRKRGIHSILFVNKQFRSEAASAFFKVCDFKISHFKLHPEHVRRNALLGRDAIENLHLVWTPAPKATFTTIQSSNKYLLSLKSLKTVKIDLLGCQYRRVAKTDIEEELQEVMVEKFEQIFDQLPAWIKQVTMSMDRTFKLLFVVYFAVGDYVRCDLSVSTSYPYNSPQT